MTFQAEKMTVNRIEIVNFHSVDCFKASFKKGVNVIENPNVLEIVFMLVSGVVPDSEKCKNEPSFVKAECSVGKSKFRIEIKSENGRFILRSPLNIMTPIEQRMSVFGVNKYDWSKEFYGYLNQDECYPYNRLSKLTAGVSATHSFRVSLNHYTDEIKEKNILNSNGAFIRPSEMSKADFQFYCFEKTLEFWDGFNEIRSPNQLLMPVIISGIKKEKITLNRQMFVEGDCI